MKIIRNATDKANTVAQQTTDTAPSRHSWKILVVDDEPDILRLTRISLRDFMFEGLGLAFVEAQSAQDAISQLNHHDDIAVALIDIVMETHDAGLKLVEYIRDRQQNTLLRIVIRTGQPGAAPERYVIDHYDIDDYKDKTELTADRLYTTVRSALKAYRDLQSLMTNRLGLEQVLHAAPMLYRLSNSASLSTFFSGILTQVIGLCRLTNASHIGPFAGIVSTIDSDGQTLQACTEQFINNPRLAEIQRLCFESIQQEAISPFLRQNAEIIPLAVTNRVVAYIYIEPISSLPDNDRNLIQVFARQCSQALENFQLNRSILSSFDSAIDMLAEIAEYKDKATGGHVNRLDHYTRVIAMAMGVDEELAIRYGKASRLHDVGKVGIPDYILSKPGPLSAEEFAIIKTHTTIGAAILGHDASFELARQIALSHHERWDGAGYPDGIASGQLPLVTRIVSVSDVFDAMISWRPYKQPWSRQQARDIIAAGANSQFDPEVVHAFLQALDSGVLDDVIRWAGKELNAINPAG